jgi:tight adherence protein B
MLILSVLAFFAVIFLLATITVAIAWMGFVKRTAEAAQAGGGRQSGAESSGASSSASDSDSGAELGDDQQPGTPLAEEDSLLFRDDRLSSVNFWDNLLARFDFVEILQIRIAQAELDWSVGRVTLLMLLGGTISGLVLGKIAPSWVALLGGAGVAFLPYGYILRRRDKRFRKFREAFPDVLDSLARALRAGYPLSAAIDLVAIEAAPMVSTEMKKTSVEANLGMGWQRALENLAQRVPLLEVNLFISAVVLHSRTGGKLSEVITGLAENMRESIALQGEVRALAAHGKLTGAILTILPVGIAAMMLMVSPGYMMVLYQHPWGKNLIGAAVGCLVLAHFVIRKIVDIKI